jgi:hypothetical protein
MRATDRTGLPAPSALQITMNVPNYQTNLIPIPDTRVGIPRSANPLASQDIKFPNEPNPISEHPSATRIRTAPPVFSRPRTVDMIDSKQETNC